MIAVPELTPADLAAGLVMADAWGRHIELGRRRNRAADPDEIAALDRALADSRAAAAVAEAAFFGRTVRTSRPVQAKPQAKVKPVRKAAEESPLTLDL